MSYAHSELLVVCVRTERWHWGSMDWLKIISIRLGEDLYLNNNRQTQVDQSVSQSVIVLYKVLFNALIQENMW